MPEVPDRLEWSALTDAHSFVKIVRAQELAQILVEGLQRALQQGVCRPDSRDIRRNEN